MKLWEDYASAKRRGLKSLCRSLLNEEVKRLDMLEGEELSNYVDNLCLEYFDNGSHEIPIQHPSILEKIYYVWEVEIKRLNPKYMIWGFKASKLCFRNIHLLVGLEPTEILEHVIKDHPSLKEASELLFKENLDILDFGLHELPETLLYEDAAYIELFRRCDELLTENETLNTATSSYGVDILGYKRLYFGWKAYKADHCTEDFDEWLNTKT